MRPRKSRVSDWAMGAILEISVKHWVYAEFFAIGKPAI